MPSVVTDDGTTQSGSLIDEIVREGARRMLAAALEAEVNHYIAELSAETDEYGRRLVRERRPGRARGAGRMNIDDIQQDPDEHVRFAAYLDKLQQVADADEVSLVSRVLADPDQTMAQSAVLRHLDRRAADLHTGPAYEGWAQAMAQATIDRPFLAQRMREWALFRAVTLKLPWQSDDLLGSSNWLQLKTAAGTNTEATEILAEAGRTKRIRNTAQASLKLSSGS